jgi:UDP-N-acetylglucosamine:LPS N-acetylglucosamine transferase
VSGDAPGPRVLILSAAIGEGHLAAARAVAEGLGPLGAEVVEVDGMPALGRVASHVIRDGYRLQLRLAPWSYSIMYGLLTATAAARMVCGALLSGVGRRRLLRLVADIDPDIIVSTHPALTCVLGRQRRRRRLAVPLVAPITDLSDYELWSHPGVDVHLVMHPHAIAPVERVAGAGSATLVRPLVAQRFQAAPDRAGARAELGLPAAGTMVAVTGGGWGVGDLAGGTAAALEAGAGAVVVVAGRNATAERGLRARFGDDPRVTVMGFTTAMDVLLRAADVLIHSTGGVTSLEALSCGCPMIAYGAKAGHIRVHNRTMAALGLIDDARTRDELQAALAVRLAQRAPSWTPGADAADAATVVAAARPRMRALPRWRVATERAVVPLLCGWAAYAGFATDDAYSLAARPLALHPIAHVATTRRAVALVLRTTPGAAPALARRLAAHGVHASFAVRMPAAAGTAPALRRTGDGLLPELPGPAPLQWLRTRVGLGNAELTGGGRAYLVPPAGPSLGQYLLARSMNAVAVTGQERFASSSLAAAPLPSAGDIVVVTADGSAARVAAELVGFTRRLSASGLSPALLSSLLASASTSDRTTGDRSSPSAHTTTTAIPATTPTG